MRRFALLIAVFALGLVIACGGGDDDDSDGDAGGSDDGATASSNDDGGGSNDSNDSQGSGDDDFCAPARSDLVFGSLDISPSASADVLRDQFGQLEDALDDWSRNAPDELEDAVETVASGMRGMIELLEENDYNFLALGTNAADDPRFEALSDPDFQAAADRLSEYCGVSTAVPSNDDSGSSSDSGSGSGFLAGALPDDYPEELIPPDSEVGFVGDVGVGLTVEFTSTATIEEIKEYYTNGLGDPTFADEESILWSSFIDGAVQAVTVSGTDGNLSVIVIGGG